MMCKVPFLLGRVRDGLFPFLLGRVRDGLLTLHNAIHEDLRFDYIEYLVASI